MYFDVAEIVLARVPALEQQVTDLKAEVKVLRDRIAALEAGTPPPEPPPDDGGGTLPPEPPTEGYRYVWISPAEILGLPTSGKEWDSLKAAADKSSNRGANIADMNEDQDIAGAMANALVAVRTGNQTYRDKAVKILTASIGSEHNSGADLLAYARNLTALIIAADVLDIRNGPVYDWLANFKTRGFTDGHHSKPTTILEYAHESGSNAPSQGGLTAAALAVYLGDRAMLDAVWGKFRRFCGDTTSPHKMTWNKWAQPFLTPSDIANPIGILPPGSTRDKCNVDGCVPNDIGRNDGTPCAPKYTFYGNTGAQGWVPEAVVFHRQGYAAFAIQDEAIKRAYLYWQKLAQSDPQWDQPGKSPEIRHLLKWAYPTLDIKITYPTGVDRTIGFSGWTHPL